ncbi:MAG: ABC transporter permease [Armatimonadota bacterium]|nr:ABC transporter permease [Armatimonadota bacterium]MDR7422743.1 ABC transporter permease [Armatimonadota bacterium]MDR7452846.1 ABC transporter permease [Armatimonadota bacterium]MDR7456158.1 ABC transporter permease [Armatimonadota bacterium]MDR7510674.1 ABC transporter permease [Armatimonadota bacterium]
MSTGAAAPPLARPARAEPPAWVEAVGVRAGSIVAAFAVGAVFLAATGHDPAHAYREMAVGAFGSSFAVEQTLVKAIPLALAGLGVALAFTMGLWNVGAEGQLAVGALAASWLALSAGGLPAAVVLPGLTLLGALGGAAWALVPAALRAYAGVNEIISTLMLNYVALLWVDYLVFGAWADPTAFSFPYSRRFPEAAHLPRLYGDVHAGALAALVAAAGLALLLGRTRWGYEIRTIGASQAAARYAGIPVRRRILLVMATSGALAGLAGAGEVSGVIHRIQQGLSPGYGFTAIIVAWVAQLRPWAVVLVAVLFAALLNGGFVLQTAGVPAAIAYMLQAMILTFVLAGEYLLRRLRRRRAVAAARALAPP